MGLCLTKRKRARRFALLLVAAIAAVLIAPAALAAEHVTLRNGFAVDCARHEADGARVRLYLLPRSAEAEAAASPAQDNYMDVDAGAIAAVEVLPEAASPAATLPAAVSAPTVAGREQRLSRVEIAHLLATAQSRHNVDADLLWSVVQAESAGQARAVSRAGAQGLMQLMPGTAAQLGVADSFAPEQNIGGGAAYLDQMLTRYHDNIALALAAYNAGPVAVDRWRDIPPYRETRAYVARVIRTFNARKRLVASR